MSEQLELHAGGGIRTRTGLTSQGILSPLRLPFRHPGCNWIPVHRRTARLNQHSIHLIGPARHAGSGGDATLNMSRSPCDYPTGR